MTQVILPEIGSADTPFILGVRERMEFMVASANFFPNTAQETHKAANLLNAQMPE